MESKLSSANSWPCGLLAIHLTSLSMSSLIYRVSLTAWKDWYKSLCSGQAFSTGSFSFHFPPSLDTPDPSMGKDPCRPLSATSASFKTQLMCHLFHEAFPDPPTEKLTSSWNALCLSYSAASFSFFFSFILFHVHCNWWHYTKIY